MIEPNDLSRSDVTPSLSLKADGERMTDMTSSPQRRTNRRHRRARAVVDRVIASPASARGRRTRAALLKAARGIFERDGFLDARITDIADLASVSHGSFYTYFSSKDEIFREVVFAMREEFASAEHLVVEEGDDPVQVIANATRQYLETYRAHAALLGTIEQVSTFVTKTKWLRQIRSSGHIGRTTDFIRMLQKRGLVDKQLDVNYVGPALSVMVTRFAYISFVEQASIGNKTDVEKSVTALTQIWARALGLGPVAANASVRLR